MSDRKGIGSPIQYLNKNELMLFYYIYIGFMLVLRIRYQNLIEQKGMHLNHDFYVVVGKQCRRKYVDGSQKQYLYID